MALNSARLSADPLMDHIDKIAVEQPRCTPIEHTPAARPFGLRFAISPIRAGQHEKTYYTVTESEATQISRDGIVETQTDQIVREKED